MGARLHRAGERVAECRDRTPRERRDAHRAAVRRGHAPPVTLAHPLLRYPARSLLLDRRSLHRWRQDVDDAMAADRGSPHRAGAVHGSARNGAEADEVTEQGDPRVAFVAAGVAHHAELTRLLLERGADPNDGETPYHTPEGLDNAALEVLVESGKLTDDSLATMLLRKADWHDYQGLKFLLEHGADPNRITHWNYTALHQAMRRDNA